MGDSKLVYYHRKCEIEFAELNFQSFFIFLFVPYILTHTLGLPSKRLRRDFLDEKEVYALALILSLVLTDPITNINSSGGAKHIERKPF